MPAAIKETPFYRLNVGARQSWDRPVVRAAKLFDTLNLFQVRKGISQASLAPQGAILQDIIFHTDWSGQSCIINPKRDERPLPEALKADEIRDCPVCNHQDLPIRQFRLAGGKYIEAYAPNLASLPQEIDIPISSAHKTNIKDITAEEITHTLMFARILIAEIISKVPGSYPYAFMHLGAVGSTIVHPIMVLGAIPQDLESLSRYRFDLGARYWQELRRDVFWEENHELTEGFWNKLMIEKFGGNGNKNRGWLLHSPFAPLASFHLRLNALQEGAFNLNRLSDEALSQLGYSLWRAINLLSQFKDLKGEQAFNNLAINLAMLYETESNPKGRMWIDLITQERPRAGMEEIGYPVDTDPEFVAQACKELLSNKTSQFPVSIFDQPDKEDNTQPKTKNDIALTTQFDPRTHTHEVIISSEEDEVKMVARYHWASSWDGLRSSLIVPPGLLPSRVSHLHYPSWFNPSRDRCFACDPEKLAFPHFIMEVLGQKVRLVTNYYGFAGGNNQPPVFDEAIQTVLGLNIASLVTPPSHLLAFTPDHLVSLEEFNLTHIRLLLHTWQTAALKIFGQNPNNKRLVNFVNFGVDAGASISHLHTQMVEVSEGMSGIIDKQIALVDQLGRVLPKRSEHNPHNFVRGLAQLKEHLSSRDLWSENYSTLYQQGLVLFETANVIAYVEKAPTFPFQVTIMAKRLGANNIRYLTVDELEDFALAMDKLKSMYLKVGVKSLNIVDESAQYDNKDSCWRYGVTFFPRAIGDQVFRIDGPALDGIHRVQVAPAKAVKLLLENEKIPERSY